MNLTALQKRVLDAVGDMQPVPLKDLAPALKVTKASAQNHLADLRELGLIRVIQQGRAKMWVLAPWRRPLEPLEQVPSVWAYAARCARVEAA
jgi:DNA-binding transcriptional ArsR family regulator